MVTPVQTTFPLVLTSEGGFNYLQILPTTSGADFESDLQIQAAGSTIKAKTKTQEMKPKKK